jgi:predicted CXXCH cytochrome family protein
MRDTVVRFAGAALCAVACAGWGAAPALSAPEKPKGDVEVTVTVEGGKVFTSCSVTAKGQQGAVTRPGEAVTLKGVTAGRVAVTAEARIAEGGAKPRRYLGVAEAAVEAGRKGTAKVTLRPVEDVDAFCLGCHPDSRDPKVKVQPGQIVKDIHVSNRVLGDKYLAQVKAYNEKVARLEKEGKPHNVPIVLEERTAVVNGKEVKQTFYTCESCHTLHQSTPWPKYARAPFRPESDLCVGCHY